MSEDRYEKDIFKKRDAIKGLEISRKFPDFHWKEISTGRWTYGLGSGENVLGSGNGGKEVEGK